MKQLQHKLTTSFKIFLFVAINFLSITQANARSWRVEQIPNGNKFNCLNCHYAPYGGPRNSFGVEVESVVARGSNDSFWNSVLAAKDSDGDGSSNGEELGDHDGDGKPTDGANITNPSDPESKPPKPVLVSAEVILSGLSQTYDGSEKKVTVTTDPAGLNVVVIYTDSEGTAVSSPTEVGKYPVVAKVSDENYKGSARGTLKIKKTGKGENEEKPEIVNIVIENDKIKLSVNFNEPFRWEKTRFESIKKFPQPWIGSPDTPQEIQLEEKGGMSWRQTDMVFVGSYRVLGKYEIEAAVSGYLLEIRGVFNPETNLLNFNGLDYVPIFHEWPRTYQWEHNGEQILGGTQSSLTIENATSKDSGLYRVTITNKLGSFTSDEAVVKTGSEWVDKGGSGEQKRPKWGPKIDTPLKVTRDEEGGYLVGVSITHGAGHDVTDWGEPALSNDGDQVVVGIKAFGPIPGKPYTKPLTTTKHSYDITRLMTNVTGSAPSVFTMKAWGKVIASRELPLNEKPRPKWVPEINIPIEIISDTGKIVAKVLIEHGGGHAIADWGRPVIKGNVISVDLETYGPVPGMVYPEIFLEDTQEYDLTKLIKSSSEHDSYVFKLTAWGNEAESKVFSVKGSVGKVLAKVTLGELRQTYDGSEKKVTVTTDPAGLNVVVIYTDSEGTAVVSPTEVGEYAVVATVDDGNYHGSISVMLSIGEASGGEDPFGEPVTYANNTHTVYGMVTLDGVAATKGDDVVVVYVGDELRGKHVVQAENEGVAYVTIQVNVNEADEQTSRFVVWDADQTDEEFQTLTLRKRISLAPGGETELLAFDFKSTLIQEARLKKGWNLISFYVESEDMTPATVLGSIKDNLVQIKNLKNSYNPALPAFINTLKGLNVRDGYWVKVSEDVNFELEGVVAEGASIPVRSGWNLVGYPRENGATPADELKSLGDTVLQFKNLKDSYNPALPAFINTLKVITPGLGYWLKVSEDGVWNVGDVSGDGGNRDIVKMGLDESRWGPVVVYPNLSATILAQVSVGGKAVTSGSVVGVFAGDELRGKQEVVLPNGRSYVAVNVNLAETEKVSFRIWDAGSDREYGVSKRMTLEMGETYGTAAELVKLDGVVPRVGVRILSYTRSPFGFEFESESGREYVVEATGDLREWKPVRTLTGAGSGVKFTDTRKSIFEKQYYRVKRVE